MKPHLLLPLLLATSVSAEEPAPGHDRKNVLFISVDDMNCDLGTYGHPQVRTPHLDRLAERGTRFDRAYCQFPLCSPSRTSVMTGMRPNTTQVYELKTHFRDIHPHVITLSQAFANDGYTTARVGKIYHYGNPGEIGTDGLDDTASWQSRFNPSGRDKQEEDQLIDYTPHRGIGSSLNWMEAEGTDAEQTDGLVAAKTVELLEENKDRPFFIACGFYRPHCPYVATRQHFAHYPLDSITLPEEPADVLDDVPSAALYTKPPNWGLNEEQRKKTIRAYRATCTFVDAQLGTVLAALDKLDLWKNTVVVFWSDHGYNLSEHSQWKKQSLFEKSARVPLVIAAPDQKQRGTACGRTVELLDLYPTLTGLCSVPTPPHTAGASLLPLLDNPNAPWDRPAFTQVWRKRFPGRSVRTERWRYTEWGVDGSVGKELYDYENDPNEFVNLAGKPDTATIESSLKSKLDRNWPAGSWMPKKMGKKKQ